MNEKRFELVSVCGDFGIINTITDDVWFFETYESVVKVVDLLNELHEESDVLKQQLQTKYVVNKQYEELQRLKKENKLLKQKIQRWKTLYEIKDKEVTARVKGLNEICNQYKYAITFDKDIDPNDAVNILCDRILQTEVGNDE